MPEAPAAGMRQHVCSLIVKKPQLIPPNKWTIVKFPYGDENESYDQDNMHALERGGRSYPYPASEVSGLIYPKHDGPFAHLNAMIQWEEARVAREYRDQFCRDPLGATKDPVNTTATDHRPPSPGLQCFTKSWDLFVHPNVPLALRVAHNYSRPINLVLVELKLSYWWYE